MTDAPAPDSFEAIVDGFRAILLRAAKLEQRVIVRSTKDGRECIATGIPRTVSPKHVVIGWRTGETAVLLDTIESIEALPARSSHET